MVTISLPSIRGENVFFNRGLTQIDGALALQSSNLLQIFIVFNQIGCLLVENNDVSIIHDLEIDETFNVLSHFHHSILVTHLLKDLQLLLSAVHKPSIIAYLNPSEVHIWKRNLFDFEICEVFIVPRKIFSGQFRESHT